MGLFKWFREVLSSSTRRKVVQRTLGSSPLRQCLSAFDLTFIGVGAMVGAGCFLLPGQVAGKVAGPAAFLAFLLSGILASLSGLCCIECSLQLPETGASYIFAYATLGELVAFLAGWGSVAVRLSALAFMGQAWSAYFDETLEGYIGNATVQFVLGGQEWNAPPLGAYPDFIAALVILLCGVTVSLGTNVFSKANSVFMITTLLTLMLVFIVAMIHADFSLVTEHGFVPENVGFAEIVTSVITAYVGYAGFDSIALAAEEVKDQSRALPIGLFSALGVSLLVYMAGVLSVTVLTEFTDIDLKTPFEAVFDDLDSLRWMKYIVAVGALCSITGGALGMSYALSRFIYPMSRDGLLPSVLSKISERTKTPLLANILTSCISAILAVFVDIKILLQADCMLYAFETIIMIFSVTILRYTPPKRSGYIELVDKANCDCITKSTSVDEASGHQNNPELKGNKQKQDSSSGTASDIDATNERRQCLSPIEKARAVTLRWIREHPKRSVVLSLCFHLISEFVFVALLTSKGDALLGVYDPGLILGIVVSGALTLISCSPLLLLPQYTDDLPFKVPLMPLLPLIALLAAVVLLLHFEFVVYIQALVWMCLGLILYFTYGIKHSVEGTRQRSAE